MTAQQFLDALRREGLAVEERPGWRSHNRNQKGPWGPLNGVMIHHTVGGENGAVDTVFNGRSDLPGPLAHGVIHKSGLVTVTGWGRANHAGRGDVRVLNAVMRDSPKRPAPGAGTVDGNPRFIGFECVNWGNGEDPWPDEQVLAMARASAAVCRFYRWRPESVIGHKEWTNQKVDPRGVSMDALRRMTGKILAKPPVGVRKAAA
jgi:hypothetical protein